MKQTGMIFAGCKLDVQQVESVVACEDIQLVLASAGSGKTLSLLAKVDYLVRTLKIPAAQILAISFTKKTVDELVERCGIEDVEFRTFHSLGNNLLHLAQPMSASKRLISEQQLTDFIQQELNCLCRNDAEFSRQYFDFLLLDYSAPINPGGYTSHAGRISLNRLFLRQALILPTPSNSQIKMALAGENIRSKDEQLIANWFYLYQIDYRYHPKLANSDSTCRPSFQILTDAEPIYLDVLALNRNGSSPYGHEYCREAIWRQRFFSQQNLTYIKVYNYEWADGNFFQKLAQKLGHFGVKLKHRSAEDLAHAVEASPTYRDENIHLRELLQTVLLLQKNNLCDIDELFSPSKHKSMGRYSEARAKRFLAIYRPIFAAYENYLTVTRQYDFADMINAAITSVKEVESCAKGYRYILVDEVQDLSKNRLELILAILRKNPECKLFAVGDDWQSIYRFTGSDPSLITGFEKYFTGQVRRSLIETTHRFANPTMDLSGKFIQKNPSQSRKRVHSGVKDQQTPIKIILNQPSARNDDSASLEIIIADLLDRYTYEVLRHKRLQLVSRYNRDAERIKNNGPFELIKTSSTDSYASRVVWRHEAMELNFDFCSMHKSKGITRDIVVVLNMNSGLTGMPAVRESDPIIDLLLAEPDGFAFGEERRLFYVAITRAREATYLIADGKTPSPFLFEISEELEAIYQILCPKCQTGELIKKQTKQGSFYYCSNFRYGCDYFRRL